MKDKDIYITSEISQEGKGGEEKGSWEGRGAGNSHPRTRSPFSLGSKAVKFSVLSSYLIIAHSQTSRCLSPTFGPTLYKFIVTGSLGLDPVRRWARLWERLLVR